MEQLHAFIGVWYKNDLTYYVKRSEKMDNYPNVWSLMSIQFDPIHDLAPVQLIMEKMSKERLGGVPIHAKELLICGDSANNTFNKHVHLYLYRVEFDFDEEPILNPDYYSDSAWLTAEEYEERSAGQPCGLCLRLWSDYAYLAGITDRPFIAK